MVFKDAVTLLPQISFRVLLHHIAPDSILNGSNSTVRQGTSNHTLKIFRVTLYFAKNYSNAITVGKAVNALIKVIHCIEGDANNFEMAPCKSKQPNLEVLNYIKGGKYPEAEFGK